MARRLTAPASDALEVDRQSQIIAYLQRHPGVAFLIRINSGGRRVHGRRWLWFYTLYSRGAETKPGTGVPDIIGMLRDGRFLAIDVKRPGEKATEDQERFLAMVAKAGGVSGTAESWIDVEKLLNGAVI